MDGVPAILENASFRLFDVSGTKKKILNALEWQWRFAKELDLTARLKSNLKIAKISISHNK